MGRGSSGSKGGGGMAAMKVLGQDGTEIDLTDMPLIYDGQDAGVAGELRKTLEEQELKHLKSKSEYALLTDADGKPLANEIHGGKGSVGMPGYLVDQANVLTHNHPRGKGESGVLGGTFSGADTKLWAHSTNMQTIRASAAEGTYSLTKGKDFNAKGFRKYVKAAEKNRMAEMNATRSKLDSDVSAGKISFSSYQSSYKGAFNKFLVDLHNDYRAGASQYGYTYTLERRQ